ncbi:hypothetical protein [Frankia sp. AgW1.1]|uniref:hypothetical protein n=1 Tax=Frankia sp. AgW1.1 TaxID=1836971 RepID=UPI0019322C42|nr:hypothetical protein [Frankia sp. AgW1.1]MBL7487023.1 hypothetical protein [Frankia sp. AgW1.1]
MADDEQLNLYAIAPIYAPMIGSDLTFYVGNEAGALEYASLVAAKDVLDGNYFSPQADVWLIGPAVKVGTANAVDVPEYPWTRGIHAAVAEVDRWRANHQVEPTEPGGVA